MAPLPTKTQEHGKRSLELVVAPLPTQWHETGTGTTLSNPPTKLKLRGLAEDQN